MVGTRTLTPRMLVRSQLPQPAPRAARWAARVVASIQHRYAKRCKAMQKAKKGDADTKYRACVRTGGKWVVR